MRSGEHKYDRASQCCHFFFFQAEDGIRDLTVTGVQTCALPICAVRSSPPFLASASWHDTQCASKNFAGGAADAKEGRVSEARQAIVAQRMVSMVQIGRASCRERV